MNPTDREIDLIFDIVVHSRYPDDEVLQLRPLRGVNMTAASLLALYIVDGYAGLRRELELSKRPDLFEVLDAAHAEDAILRGGNL